MRTSQCMTSDIIDELSVDMSIWSIDGETWTCSSTTDTSTDTAVSDDSFLWRGFSHERVCLAAVLPALRRTYSSDISDLLSLLWFRCFGWSYSSSEFTYFLRINTRKCGEYLHLEHQQQQKYQLGSGRILYEKSNSKSNFCTTISTR